MASALLTAPSTSSHAEVPPAASPTLCDLELHSSGTMSRLLLANAASQMITNNEGLVDGLMVPQKLKLFALARGVSLVSEGGLAVPSETLLQLLQRSHSGTATQNLPFCLTRYSGFHGDAEGVLRSSLNLRIQIAELLSSNCKV